MKWTQVRIKTITEAEDVIISLLYDYGFEGAQIEDKIPLTPLEKEQMFVDIPPVTEEDDGVAYLNFYIPQDDEHDIDAMIQAAENELQELRGFNMNIGEGTITVSETEDIDWINNWKQYFHQFNIDDILVIPSWEETPVSHEGLVLHIDPGTAFGTGMHETTQLCIRQLRKFITSETHLLDVGTGSGILGILSLMFGAKDVVGTDLDPCAVPAVDDNLKNNGIDPDKFKLIIGNIIDTKEVQDEVGYDCYDIVVANILADVLVPLTPVITQQLKKGGIYITSGIIHTDEISKDTVVKEAMEAAGFEVIDISYQGEWASVTGRKK